MKIKNISIAILSVLTLKSYAFSKSITDLNCGDYFSYNQEQAETTNLNNYQCKTYMSPKIIYKNGLAGLIKVKMFFGHHKATKTKKGTIFINYGGPGQNASKNLYKQVTENQIPKSILEHFDIIGLDPRGTGASEYATYLNKCQIRRMGAKTDKNCIYWNPPMTIQIGTNNYIDDINELRKLLNEEKIHFIGISYGGTVGMQYAHKYRNNIGALVLDSPAAPKIRAEGENGGNIDESGYLNLIDQFKRRAYWFIEKAFEFDENSDMEDVTDLANKIFAKTKNINASSADLRLFKSANGYLSMHDVRWHEYPEYTNHIDEKKFADQGEKDSLKELWGAIPRNTWRLNFDEVRFNEDTEKEIVKDLFLNTKLQEESILKMLKAAKKYYFITPNELEETETEDQGENEETKEEVFENYIEYASKTNVLVRIVDMHFMRQFPNIGNLIENVNIKNLDALLIEYENDTVISNRMQNEIIENLQNSTKIIIENGHYHGATFRSYEHKPENSDTDNPATENIYDKIDKYVTHYLMNYGSKETEIHKEIEKGQLNKVKDDFNDAKHFREQLNRLNYRLKRVDAMFEFLNKLETGEIKY